MSAHNETSAMSRTFEDFIAAVNRHDVDALGRLMAREHLFVDSLGNRVRGAERMRSGWGGYFAMCPDYSISIAEVLCKDALVLAAGTAGGTIDGRSWQTPAAWLARGADGLITEWRVFADNKPVYDILARRGLEPQA